MNNFHWFLVCVYVCVRGGGVKHGTTHFSDFFLFFLFSIFLSHINSTLIQVLRLKKNKTYSFLWLTPVDLKCFPSFSIVCFLLSQIYNIGMFGSWGAEMFCLKLLYAYPGQYANEGTDEITHSLFLFFYFIKIEIF